MKTTIKNQQELETAVADIGRLQSKRLRLETEAKDKIATVQEKLRDQTALLDPQIEALSQAVKKFADKHQAKLFPEDSRTAKLTTGELRRRKIKRSVRTRQSPKLIETILVNNGLSKLVGDAREKLRRAFLRIKLELDKEAILADPEAGTAATGVELEEARERFYICPSDLDHELEVKVA